MPEDAISVSSVLIVPFTGVPTAPNETGEESSIKAKTAAAKGGKPNTISKGAAKAAGVPKPAAPSINATKNTPIIISCTLLSSDIALKPLLISPIAPEYFMVFKIKIAPKIIIKISKDLKNPNVVYAKRLLSSIFHILTTITAVKIYAIGSAFLAAILNAVIKTTTRIKGDAPIKANIVIFLP